MRWVGATVPVLVLCVALGIIVAHAKPPETPDYLSTGKVRIETSNNALAPDKVANGATDTRTAAAQEFAPEEKVASTADAAERRAPVGTPLTTAGGRERRL